MIKLIVSDVDGTLIADHSSNNMNPQIFDLIEECHKREIQFAVASGRQYYNLKQLFAPVWDEIYMLPENGNAILFQDKVIHQVPMPKELVQSMAEYLYHLEDCYMLVSTAKVAFILNKAPEFSEKMFYTSQAACALLEFTDLSYLKNEDVIKMSVLAPAGKELEVSNRIREDWGNYCSITRSGGQWIDISLSSKGAAVRRLGLDAEISPDQIMVFGDNYNDEQMFTAATHSYCMASADDYLKSRAAYVTETVEEAIAYYLETGNIKK